MIQMWKFQRVVEYANEIIFGTNIFWQQMAYVTTCDKKTQFIFIKILFNNSVQLVNFSQVECNRITKFLIKGCLYVRMYLSNEKNC